MPGSRMSLVDEGSANGVSAEACAVCLQGRYEVVRELGRGGMGAVFLVADRRRDGRLLALKKVRVSPTEAEVAEALRNEFLAVASLRHPGLAEIYDFGIDRSSSEYFFTSEFVEGVNFYEALRRRDPARSEEVGAIVELSAQVLRALEFLHTRGIVHGDIKPENILVTGLSDDEPAAARAKLIDFGLARREKQFGGRNVVGTLYYIAPETITGSQVDRRTDLYSLGCVLFHVLTGVPPFASPENVEILRGHLERPPARPSQLRPGIPEWLERFILRLVEKNPASRYASALEALAALSEDSGRPLPLETPETLRSYVESVRPGNVESQLAAVFGAFRASCGARGQAALRDLHVALEERSGAAGRLLRAARASEGRFVIVRGEDSLAKAQLAEGFRQLVQAQGACFLPVDCGAPGGAHADFLALLEEIRSFASASDRAGPLLADCEALELSVNSGDPPADVFPAFEGFARHLFDASLEAPVVLCLRELDRTGDLVAGFARRLIEEQVEKTFPANQVFVLATTGSVRGEGPGLRRVLRSTKSREGALELDVGRLDEAATARFLEAMFSGNDFPETLSHELYEESGGEPSSLVALLRFLLEGGTIARTPCGWTLAAEIRAEELPAQARETLRAKVRHLPEDARRVARAFAVLGDGTELDLAAELAALPRAGLIEPMGYLREAGIVEEDRERLGVYSFAHPRARELLYREIPDGERRELHRQAAALLAARGGEDGEAAVHLLRSGDGAAGAPAGIAAAKRLAAAGDLREAIRVYDEVLRAAGASDRAVSEEVAYEKARLLHELARYREALEILAPLADARRVDGRAPHPTLVLVGAAASATRLGEHRRAAEYLDRAATVEKSQIFPVCLVYVLAGYAELAAELERWSDCAKYCERVLEDRERIHDKKLLRDVVLLLAEAAWAGGAADRAATLCRDALELADSADRGAWLESSLAVLARHSEYRGKYLEASKQLQARIALRRRRGLAEASGRAYLDLGRLELALERTRAAARTLRRAERLLQRAGDAGALARARSLLARVCGELGEREDCRSAIAEAVRYAKRTDGASIEASTLATCAELALDRGDFEGSERYAEAAARRNPSDPALAFRLLALESEAAVQRGRYAEAFGAIERALDPSAPGRGPASDAAFLERQALLETHLGARDRAQATLQIWRSLAARHGFALSAGRCHLVEGLLAAGAKRREAAGRHLGLAFRTFREAASERDLARLYVAYSEFLVETDQKDQALLYAEEAAYLSKRLELAYWRCRAHLASGAAKLACGGDDARAGELLRRAAAAAKKLSFLDILWRSLYHQALLASRAGDRSAAAGLLEEASAVRGRVLGATPPAYREGCLEASWDRAFETLAAEVRG